MLSWWAMSTENLTVASSSWGLILKWLLWESIRACSKWFLNKLTAVSLVGQLSVPLQASTNKTYLPKCFGWICVAGITFPGEAVDWVIQNVDLLEGFSGFVHWGTAVHFHFIAIGFPWHGLVVDLIISHKKGLSSPFLVTFRNDLGMIWGSFYRRGMLPVSDPSLSELLSVKNLYIGNPKSNGWISSSWIHGKNDNPQ